MCKPIVFMFSGQGSQYYQMGKELYEKHPRFKLWMDHCDSIAFPLLGRSLVEIIYSSEKVVPFDEICYSNPALLSIEFSLAKILMEAKIQPDILLGYSLGELTAQVTSGAVSLNDGIRFSIEIAELIKQESPNAGMLAVIDSADIISQYPKLFESCWLTAKNFENNFVVGGIRKDIEQLHRELLKKKIVNQILPVNYGFHTQLMEPLKNKMLKLCKSLVYCPSRIPTYSSLGPNLQVKLSEEHIWQVFRYQVDFSGAINSLLDKGEHIFIDVGPSGTLATFVKYLMKPNSSSQFFEVVNQFGRDLNSLHKLTQNISVAA